MGEEEEEEEEVWAKIIITVDNTNSNKILAIVDQAGETGRK